MADDARLRLLRLGKKAVKIGSDLADVLVHVRANPSVLAVASVAARALSSYQEATERPADSFFANWTLLRDAAAFDEYLYAMMFDGNVLREREDVRAKDSSVYLGRIHGLDFGWVKSQFSVQGPWIPQSQDLTTSVRGIGRYVWERLGTTVTVDQVPMVGTVFRPDPLRDFLPSPTGDRLYERMVCFLRAGHPRSVLLHGEPGTGKSHLMRYVAHLAGGFVLRFRPRSLERISSIAAAIRMMCPSAVLVDDLDRVEHPDAILSEIDQIRGSTGLFLCSVNFLDRLDPAVLRVGRFDEIVEVNRLDDIVIDAMIGPDVPAEVAAELRDLPVACIHEFKRRMEVLGAEQALAEVRSLVERTARIRHMCGVERSKRSKADTPPTI